jgi:hypothetical protein
MLMLEPLLHVPWIKTSDLSFRGDEIISRLIEVDHEVEVSNVAIG